VVHVIVAMNIDPIT